MAAAGPGIVLRSRGSWDNRLASSETVAASLVRHTGPASSHKARQAKAPPWVSTAGQLRRAPGRGAEWSGRGQQRDGIGDEGASGT